MTYYLELGRLQGFPTDKLRMLLQVRQVEQTAVGKAIANSTSVDVLMRILPRLLAAAGLIQQRVHADMWKTMTRAKLMSMETLPDDIYP